jgi:hypothetical protein
MNNILLGIVAIVILAIVLGLFLMRKKDEFSISASPYDIPDEYKQYTKKCLLKPWTHNNDEVYMGGSDNLSLVNRESAKVFDLMLFPTGAIGGYVSAGFTMFNLYQPYEGKRLCMLIDAMKSVVLFTRDKAVIVPLSYPGFEGPTPDRMINLLMAGAGLIVIYV